MELVLAKDRLNDAIHHIKLYLFALPHDEWDTISVERSTLFGVKTELYSALSDINTILVADSE